MPGQYQRDAYLLTQLQYQDSFVDNTLHLTARLFTGRERYRSTLSYGTPRAFPATSTWRGAELRVLSTAWDGHRLMMGLEAQDNVRYDQACIT